MSLSRMLLGAMLIGIAGCGDARMAATALPEHSTRAASEAANTYGSSVGKAGGIWLVEDVDGTLVAAGVVDHFPSEIGSETYEDVVPAAKGHDVVGFGFARTPGDASGTPYRLVYIRVARPGGTPRGA